MSSPFTIHTENEVIVLHHYATGREVRLNLDDLADAIKIRNLFNNDGEFTLQTFFPDMPTFFPDMPTFSVLEWSTGFEVVHNATDKRHWMSDGVDALFGEDDEPMCPGSPGFREAWEKSLNDSEDETMEAYFPDI